MDAAGTSPSRRALVVTAEFNASDDVDIDVAVFDDEEIVDIVELVVSNQMFRDLAHALRLDDPSARTLLRRAMDDAGTHVGIISAEDVWFMLPRIETDVLAHFVDQDASIRREQLHELLRRTRYEAGNSLRLRRSERYARLA